jgi:2-keto-3-deoxy-L-rhamnonate aldolase RhmA
VLKTRLRSHAVTLGSWITIGHPAVAEIMARAGFDWLVVDLEHSVLSIAQAGELIRTIDLCGVTPLVRLTSNQPDQIKRVMDAGSHGIIVPMVNSPDDAAKAVAATRYAPRGSRGVGIARAQGYGVGFQDYLKWQADGPVVIVQIEHTDAVERLEEILTVPGVDGFIVGPYDLSCSMGFPGQFEREEFRGAMRRIREASHRRGCPGGLHIVEPDPAQLERALGEGYSFIAYSVDFRILDAGARAGIATMKAALP